VLPKLLNVVCLAEHHSKEQEIETLSVDHCTLDAKFCRQNLKHGRKGIFLRESLAFTNIDLQEFCIEQDIEKCGQIKPTIHVFTDHRLAILYLS
jgi:hypothetical protein